MRNLGQCSGPSCYLMSSWLSFVIATGFAFRVKKQMILISAGSEEFTARRVSTHSKDGSHSKQHQEQHCKKNSMNKNVNPEFEDGSLEITLALLLSSYNHHHSLTAPDEGFNV